VILVDSCGWLEVLKGSPLGEAYRPAFTSFRDLPGIHFVETLRD